jgi:hypothetical protein
MIDHAGLSTAPPRGQPHAGGLCGRTEPLTGYQAALRGRWQPECVLPNESAFVVAFEALHEAIRRTVCGNAQLWRRRLTVVQRGRPGGAILLTRLARDSAIRLPTSMLCWPTSAGIQRKRS